MTKRYAISMYCYRIERFDNPEGLRPGTQSIIHNPGVVEATSIYEAAGIGVEIVRKLFPTKDGWLNHDVKVCEIDNVLTVANAAVRESR